MYFEYKAKAQRVVEGSTKTVTEAYPVQADDLVHAVMLGNMQMDSSDCEYVAIGCASKNWEGVLNAPEFDDQEREGEAWWETKLSYENTDGKNINELYLVWEVSNLAAEAIVKKMAEERCIIGGRITKNVETKLMDYVTEEV